MALHTSSYRRSMQHMGRWYVLLFPLHVPATVHSPTRSAVDPVTIVSFFVLRWDGRLFPNNHLSFLPLSFAASYHTVGDPPLDDTWLIQHQTLAKICGQTQYQYQCSINHLVVHGLISHFELDKSSG
jgi:hypothetical protein